MPASVAKKAIDLLFADGLVKDNISIVWHAGEPLVVPQAFYLDIYNHVQKYSNVAVIRHHFQTNGVLIDEGWCSLFKKLGARVGVSIDGPKEIHDKNRRYRNDKGSFEQALAGLKLLQEHGIEHHIISVISQESLAKYKDVLSFYRDCNAQSIGFNIEEIEGTNAASTLSNDSRKTFGDFVAQVIALHKSEQIRSREIRSLEQFFQRSVRITDNDQNVPLRIITVDARGGFSTFSPELHGMTVGSDQFVFGNVTRDSYVDMFGNPVFLKIYQDIIAGNELCKTNCKYFGACGGGAPSNKYYENGSFSTDETIYCRLKIKEIIDQFVKYDGGGNRAGAYLNLN